MVGCEAGAERPVCFLEGEGTVRSHHVKKKPTQESRARKWRETSPVDITGHLDPAVPECLLPLNLLIM